jgi:hypothetical protein
MAQQIGGLLLIVAGVIVIFAGFMADVSVLSEVANLDLMQQRQNRIILGCFIVLFGVIYRVASLTGRHLAQKGDQ